MGALTQAFAFLGGLLLIQVATACLKWDGKDGVSEVKGGFVVQQLQIGLGLSGDDADGNCNDATIAKLRNAVSKDTSDQPDWIKWDKGSRGVSAVSPPNGVSEVDPRQLRSAVAEPDFDFKPAQNAWNNYFSESAELAKSVAFAGEGSSVSEDAADTNGPDGHFGPPCNKDAPVCGAERKCVPVCGVPNKACSDCTGCMRSKAKDVPQHFDPAFWDQCKHCNVFTGQCKLHVCEVSAEKHECAKKCFTNEDCEADKEVCSKFTVDGGKAVWFCAPETGGNLCSNDYMRRARMLFHEFVNVPALGMAELAGARENHMTDAKEVLCDEAAATYYLQSIRPKGVVMKSKVDGRATITGNSLLCDGRLRLQPRVEPADVDGSNLHLSCQGLVDIDFQGITFRSMRALKLGIGLKNKPTMPVENEIDQPPDAWCCVICRRGQACGDKCIERDQTCTARKPGCACNSNPQVVKSMRGAIQIGRKTETTKYQITGLTKDSRTSVVVSLYDGRETGLATNLHADEIAQKDLMANMKKVGQWHNQSLFRLCFADTPVSMCAFAGLSISGKLTLQSKLAEWAKSSLPSLFTAKAFKPDKKWKIRTTRTREVGKDSKYSSRAVYEDVGKTLLKVGNWALKVKTMKYDVVQGNDGPEISFLMDLKLKKTEEEEDDQAKMHSGGSGSENGDESVVTDNANDQNAPEDSTADMPSEDGSGSGISKESKEENLEEKMSAAEAKEESASDDIDSGADTAVDSTEPAPSEAGSGVGSRRRLLSKMTSKGPPTLHARMQVTDDAKEMAFSLYGADWQNAFGTGFRFKDFGFVVTGQPAAPKVEVGASLAMPTQAGEKYIVLRGKPDKKGAFALSGHVALPHMSMNAVWRWYASWVQHTGSAKSIITGVTPDWSILNSLNDFKVDLPVPSTAQSPMSVTLELAGPLAHVEIRLKVVMYPQRTVSAVLTSSEAMTYLKSDPKNAYLFQGIDLCKKEGPSGLEFISIYVPKGMDLVTPKFMGVYVRMQAQTQGERPSRKYLFSYNTLPNPLDNTGFCGTDRSAAKGVGSMPVQLLRDSAKDLNVLFDPKSYDSKKKIYIHRDEQGVSYTFKRVVRMDQKPCPDSDAQPELHEPGLCTWLFKKGSAPFQPTDTVKFAVLVSPLIRALGFFNPVPVPIPSSDAENEDDDSESGGQGSDIGSSRGAQMRAAARIFDTMMVKRSEGQEPEDVCSKCKKKVCTLNDIEMVVRTHFKFLPACKEYGIYDAGGDKTAVHVAAACPGGCGGSLSGSNQTCHDVNGQAGDSAEGYVIAGMRLQSILPSETTTPEEMNTQKKVWCCLDENA